MDSLITAAARCLAAGDPIGALKRVALREDAAALALRGIAMAQLGDLPRSRELLRAAARAFSPREQVARARCVVAEAEIALVSRDITWATRRLAAARAMLEAHGDHGNALHARYLGIRHLLLVGQLDAAQEALVALPARQPPVFRVAHGLIAAQIAMRRVQARQAGAALARAERAAISAGIPALQAEVQRARQILAAPAARLLARGTARLLRLAEVEALLSSGDFIVDDCRHVVRYRKHVVKLATRPVLRALLCALAEVWPGDASRDQLVQRVFRLSPPDASHRARLRVEVGRLRRLLARVATIEATVAGYRLSPRRARAVRVLARPVEHPHADVLAFLADGEAWSTSALAQALGVSQRTVQRSLEALELAGQVRPSGRGRARRWIAPQLPGFTTLLLLPAALPAG